MRRKPNLDHLLVASSARTEGGGAYREAADMDTMTADDAEGILAIAYQMALANGAVSSDESLFLDALCNWLAARTSASAMEAAFERVKTESGLAEDIVRRRGAALGSRKAREIAFKAAFALRVWDLETNPAEETLEKLLAEALDLGETAADLIAEVNAVLMDG